MRISLEDLRQAATRRGPSYMDDMMALGYEADGFLVIPDARISDYEAAVRKVRGLGDAVAVFTEATGIASASRAVANALGVDCGCDGRQAWLNEAVPFNGKAVTMEAESII